jgi:oxygen-independent coproporphyrinogen-3 oxidase
LTRWFPLRPGVEFTVESNPNTLTAEKVEILARHGVNRVSLGAQSFQRHLLGRLERDHDPDSVGRAVEMLRPYIPRVSIDLIFGVPSQTLPEWQEDLGKALALGVTHLSAYGLTYEKGTPLWKQRRLGIVEPIDEGVEADMYEHLLGAMDSAGWCGYEISNFHAIDTGEPCRHNLAYWANAPYYGFGTGAAAFVDGRRTLNLRPIVNYLETVEAGLSPICQGETLDGPARARETAVLNLRRAQGLDKKEFLGQTGFDIDHLAGASVRPMMDLGLLEDDGRRWRLTRAGFLLADGVLARIV